MVADDLMLWPVSGAAEGLSSKACLIVGTREHACAVTLAGVARVSQSFWGEGSLRGKKISQGLQQNLNADLAGFVLGAT